MLAVVAYLVFVIDLVILAAAVGAMRVQLLFFFVKVKVHN
jgi:hypothetical protein